MFQKARTQPNHLPEVLQPLYKKFQVIFINLITVGVMLLILEGIIYLGMEKPSAIPGGLIPYFRSYYLSSDRQIIQVTPCGKYDPDLFYLLREGPCAFKNREFEVMNYFNSAGVRDDQNSMLNPEAIVLGDSYAMGWGVDQDDAFPQVLEKLSGLKVLNTGVSSYGTAREFLLLERLNLNKPRFIVIQYHRNDYEENAEYLANDFKLPIRSERSFDSLVESTNSRQRYFPLKHIYGITKSVGLTIRGPRGPLAKLPSDEEEVTTFLSILNHHAALLEGVQIIVFKIDDADKLNDRFADMLNAKSKEDRYSGLNVTAIPIANLFTENDYFILDDHINSSGHRKLAAAINQEITKFANSTVH